MHGEQILPNGKERTLMEMTLFAITGKSFDKSICDFLDRVSAIVGCYPDPRLWNNRVAALAAISRSTAALGVSAGIATSDAIIFGFQPMCGAFRFFEKVKTCINEGKPLGETLKSLAQVKVINGGRPGKGKRRDIAAFPGFGRPTATKDERIGDLIKIAKRYGFSQHPTVKLAFEIEQWLEGRGCHFRLNSGGLLAAFGLDQGLTAEQFYLYILHSFNVGLQACYGDALEHRAGVFFPLKCTEIAYEGPPERKWDSKRVTL